MCRSDERTMQTMHSAPCATFIKHDILSELITQILYKINNIIKIKKVDFREKSILNIDLNVIYILI